MEKKSCKKYIVGAGVCLLIVAGLVYYWFFSSLTSASTTQYVYIDNDDTIDSVYAKIRLQSNEAAFHGFKTLVRHSHYADRIRSGRYALKPGVGAFVTFRHLKNGMQEPVDLTIPSVRTLGDLCNAVDKKLLLNGDDLYRFLSNEDSCRQYGYDTTTIACMFIPNTYDIYWNVSLHKFLDRMKKENNRFWSFERKEKAAEMHLTPNQVITLASIVDEETANDDEKPMIAGMYYNRLKLRNAEYPDGMPLQADPTIKYAWKRFDLKRIYHNLLTIDSPYNTYKYPGLPPGPIRIPSVAGIDAVLDHVHHDYLYMCAKEDFSGTHNFARTYEEHLRNAARYSEALNKRGIK